MLENLVMLVAHDASAERASREIERIYGVEALAVVARHAASTQRAPARARLEALRRRLMLRTARIFPAPPGVSPPVSPSLQPR